MKIRNLFSPAPFTSGLICSGDDEGEGDGGSGGGMSDEQRDLIMRTVNAAVSTQLGRKLPAAIESSIKGAMEPFQAELSKIAAPAPGKATAKDSEDPRIAGLLKQQEAMKAQLESEQKARRDQENQTREASRNSAVQGALSKAGVEPLRMKGAMAEILATVQVGDDGSPFIRSTAKGYDEDLTLEDGIAAWSGTDVGKSYLSAQPAAGSGAKAPGRGGGPRPGNIKDPAAAKAARIAEARGQLRGQVASMLGSSAAVNITGGGQGQSGSGEG